ncbi:Trichome birefringence-like, N-terminal domain [Dillenia turbinata]|uniref:Trichome birefringence-like, N-terminal domain n=1 Tax=Dillenia turbinata TaxID=194707 RepID=A0AAN8Z7X7_9MAGN
MKLSLFSHEFHLNTIDGFQKIGRVVPFASSLLLIGIISLLIYHSSNNYKAMTSQQQYALTHQKQVPNHTHTGDNEECDIFKGHWIQDPNAYLYDNLSCPTLPDWKNCFKHGRKDREFVNWRWKPENCELPRFDAKAFLKIVQGKTMAFVGDSLARNHVESLLCLLSRELVPVQKGPEDEKSPTWYFPLYNFTLLKIWSPFLVKYKERIVNDNADLYLDEVDNKWAEKLPEIDYVIMSDNHWFFRKNYLYEHGNLIGCLHCGEQNLTDFEPHIALGKAFRTALGHINGCKGCKSIVTWVRTLSPGHFENGSWNAGGFCNRTRPFSEEELNVGGSYEMQLRKIQIEEVERARKEGTMAGNRFEILDITKLMFMRPDGHPNSHWHSHGVKGYNDCVHWCLPGPVDTWNDFLLAMLRKELNSTLKL